MRRLPDAAVKLIEGKNFAHLATLMPDGSPHVTTVWIDHEGDVILVNTAEGRVKEKNVKRDPRVAISVADHQNPYHRAFIRGRVLAVTRERAEANIDELAKKYMGQDKYPHRVPRERRVLIKIEPTYVTVR